MYTICTPFLVNTINFAEAVRNRDKSSSSQVVVHSHNLCHFPTADYFLVFMLIGKVCCALAVAMASPAVIVRIT